MPRGGSGGHSHSGSHGGFSSHSRSSSRSHSSSRSSGGGFSSHSSSRSRPSSRSSFGGFSSHSSRRPSYDSPSRRVYSHGGFGTRRRPARTPLFMPASRRSARGRPGIGCTTLLILFVFLTIFANFVPSSRPASSRREPLESGQCQTVSVWYEDDWGDWIDSASSAEKNNLVQRMQAFYDRTGVQPFLWITGEDGALIGSEDELETWAREKYSQLFSDSGHLLVIFREYPNASGDYLSGAYAGQAAERVMDAQARDILLTNIDRYYDDTSLSEAELFARAFKKTAEEIMGSSASGSSGSRSGAIILVVIALAAYWVYARMRRRASLSAAQTAVPDAETAQAEETDAEDNEPAPQPGPSPQTSSGGGAVKCPSCGATSLLSSPSPCPYCGTPLNP